MDDIKEKQCCETCNYCDEVDGWCYAHDKFTSPDDVCKYYVPDS